MSLVHAFMAQPTRVIAFQVVIVAAIVLAATLATIIFNGPGAGVPFDTRLDQMALPF